MFSISLLENYSSSYSMNWPRGHEQHHHFHQKHRIRRALNGSDHDSRITSTIVVLCARAMPMVVVAVLLLMMMVMLTDVTCYRDCIRLSRLLVLMASCSQRFGGKTIIYNDRISPRLRPVHGQTARPGRAESPGSSGFRAAICGL